MSNILAELTVVPAVVGGTLAVLGWWRRGVLMPRFEAVVLGFSLFGIAWLNFRTPSSRIPALRVMSSQTPLAVQLPFLLWAAMRFGPTGAGITILMTTIVTSWGVVHGVGPFASIAPATTVTALTLSLIVVASTLLCLATLVEERRQAQHALAIRLEFEGLLSRSRRRSCSSRATRCIERSRSGSAESGRVLGIDWLTVFTASTPAAISPAFAWRDPLTRRGCRSGRLGTRELGATQPADPGCRPHS